MINEGTSLHKLLKSTVCWGNTGGTTHYTRVKVRQLAVESMCKGTERPDLTAIYFTMPLGSAITLSLSLFIYKLGFKPPASKSFDQR